jgi:hypothetical protein
MLNPKSLQSQSGNGSPYSWFRFWFFLCSVRQFMQDMSGKSPLYKKCVLNPFTFQCVLSLYEEWCFCNWILSHFLLLAAFRLLCTVPCLSTHEWILSTCVAGPMCFLAHPSVATCYKLSRVTNQFFHELLLFERYKKSCLLSLLNASCSLVSLDKMLLRFHLLLGLCAETWIFLLVCADEPGVLDNWHTGTTLLLSLCSLFLFAISILTCGDVDEKIHSKEQCIYKLLMLHSWSVEKTWGKRFSLLYFWGLVH